jgi:hypothetical protein
MRVSHINEIQFILQADSVLTQRRHGTSNYTTQEKGVEGSGIRLYHITIQKHRLGNHVRKILNIPPPPPPCCAHSKGFTFPILIRVRFRVRIRAFRFRLIGPEEKKHSSQWIYRLGKKDSLAVGPALYC